VSEGGSPEIERIGQGLNELSKTLQTLSLENRRLLRQIVEVQDDERRDLSRHIIEAVEEEDDEGMNELLSASREGAESGAMDPVTVVAAGAAVGFVILCAKLKRVDLAKRVLTFGKMPDSLANVLKALIGIA